MAARMQAPRFKTVTYFDARCEVAAIGTSGANTRGVGERFVIGHWLDDADERNGGHPAGTVVVKHMIGDGRTPDFRLLDTVIADGVDEAVAWVAMTLGLDVPETEGADR